MPGCVVAAEDGSNGWVRYVQTEILLRVTHP